MRFKFLVIAFSAAILEVFSGHDHDENNHGPCLTEEFIQENALGTWIDILKRHKPEFTIRMAYSYWRSAQLVTQVLRIAFEELAGADVELTTEQNSRPLDDYDKWLRKNKLIKH